MNCKAKKEELLNKLKETEKGMDQVKTQFDNLVINKHRILGAIGLMNEEIVKEEKEEKAPQVIDMKADEKETK